MRRHRRLVVTFLLITACAAFAGFLIGRTTSLNHAGVLDPNQLIDVAVPVVECPTINAQSQSLTTRFPSTIGIALPRHLADSFDFYSDSIRSYIPMLGPRGWQCNFEFSTDGSMGITIKPLGTSSEQIQAFNTGAATGEALFTACPYFPSATRQLLREGEHCIGPKNHDEQVTTVYGAFTPSTINGGIVEFHIPTRPTGPVRRTAKYPSVGLVEFSGVPQPIPSTTFEDCVLPATQMDICREIASQFLTGDWGSAAQ